MQNSHGLRLAGLLSLSIPLVLVTSCGGGSSPTVSVPQNNVAINTNENSVQLVAEDDLIITGVIDGPLSGGTPKAIELFVVNNIPDLSIYGLGSANNGGGTDGEEFTFPSDSATAGEYIYVTTDDTQFQSFFGFGADYVNGAAPGINGDDAIELFTNGSVSDIFGEIDGSNQQAWDYQDGWAYRNMGTGPDGATFAVNNWTYSGANALDGETTNASASTPFPLGTYSGGPGPSPSPGVTPSPGATTPIYMIQGSGGTSPQVGQTVTIQGIVTAEFQSDGLDGYFVQEVTGDGDPATSDGIFVQDTSNSVSAGDIVQLTGQVEEEIAPSREGPAPGADFTGFTNTQIINVSNFSQVSTGSLPAPVELTLPEATEGDLEAFEGMYVQISSTMTVSQTFFLGRYGQITLASPDDNGAPGRLFNPTNLFDAGSGAAVDLDDENARRLLILDDGQDQSFFGDNPDPVPYIGAPPPQVIRAGDQVTGLVGVLDFGLINSAGAVPEPVLEPDDVNYRFHPVQAPNFVALNNRPNTPDSVGGSLTVAGFNLLNFFNTIDTGSPSCGGARCRGADSNSELTRQTDKLVAAFDALDADIVGLVELENDYTSGTSSAETLVNALNASGMSSCSTYDFVDPGVLIGDDVIAVGFLYCADTVQLAAGTTIEILDDSDLAGLGLSGLAPVFDGPSTSRAVLAATFEEIASGEDLTIAVNHFKSKGSPCDAFGDPEDPNGQGNCNQTRDRAAQALAAWLATDPTGSGDPDVMIVGDLNAYAEEDPIQTLEASGYTNLIEQFEGQEAYSFIFDGEAGYLDHALANASLTAQVSGLTEWHINTDEPPVIDYNQDFNPAGYYAVNPFRSSDHDPVVVGLNLSSGVQPSPSPSPEPSDFEIFAEGLGSPEDIELRGFNFIVPDSDSGNVFQVSAFNGNRVLRTGTGLGDATGIGVNGFALYATNAAGEFLQLRTFRNRPIATFTLPTNVDFIGSTPYIIDQTDGTLSSVNLFFGTTNVVASGLGSLSDLAVDGRDQIFVVNREGQVLAVAVNSGALNPITDQPDVFTGVALPSTGLPLVTTAAGRLLQVIPGGVSEIADLGTTLTGVVVLGNQAYVTDRDNGRIIEVDLP